MNNKSKLVIIGPVFPYRGGISHHTTLLAENLRKANFDVTILSFKKQYPRWLYPGTSDKDTSDNPIEIDANFILEPFNVLSWFKIIMEIQKINPNLVIFQWWTTFWSFAYKFVCYFLIKKGFRLVFLIHNVLPHEKKIWDQILSKITLSSEIEYIVQSSGEQEKLNQILPGKKTYLVEHPIYKISQVNDIDSVAAKKILNIDFDNKILLFFGIIRSYKGLDMMIKSIVQIVSNYSKNIKLIIAGEFWEPIEDYENLIKSLLIGDYVKIYNKYIPNEEIPLFFSAADVFVAPYKDCTQSGAVKLAMGYGLPIVISPIVSDSIIDKYSNIWIMEDYNEDNLAKKIIEALENGQKISVNFEDQWQEMIKVIQKLVFEDTKK